MIGEIMKQYIGFTKLFADRGNPPDPGWIFVDPGTDDNNIDTLRSATFYVPENDEDEFDGEERLQTLVEAPTFQDIIALRAKNSPTATADQFLEALVHYLVHDDFLE